MQILKCMWHLFSRLERISMTAEMRSRNFATRRYVNDFVYGTTERINYDKWRLNEHGFQMQQTNKFDSELS
ncbi:hypothetical protein CAEBREN_30046 [Caenorhabditis brenneri]|uniref:NR LBD domain-containing protein n=1 Tax=Caenorhabditis brenneri TaxID=135651 RepID=G0NXB9_CAEBE|nr:hypothetical protein CAEBREN_30046 [Caenorhabditis brenneri]